MFKCNARIAEPDIGEEEIKAVVDVLKSRWLAHGPIVEEFERRFAEYVGARHAVAVANGTAALKTLLWSLGIREGDEVIVPCFTFFATASTAIMVGAKPVFADIELETYNVDPESVLERITPRTKAIVVVHLYGHPANMRVLREIAEDFNLILVEDAAQAHGARTPEGSVGGLGDGAAFSFYATKNMTTGEGGMITTNRDDVAELARLYRDHGQASKYVHVVLGENFRMTSIQAAIGLVQLARLEDMIAKRRRNASILNEALKGTGLLLPVEKPGYRHVYHQYVVRVDPEKTGVSRDRLAEELRGRGVGVAIHYPKPLPDQPLFRALGYPPASAICPNALLASRQVLSLPVHSRLSVEQVRCVGEAVKEVLAEL